MGLVPKSPIHIGLICAKTRSRISHAWAPLSSDPGARKPTKKLPFMTCIKYTLHVKFQLYVTAKSEQYSDPVRIRIEFKS